MSAIGGAKLDARRVSHAEALGPCRASVTVDAVRTNKGRLVYRLTEVWEPRVEGVGEIQVTTLHDDALTARRLAIDAEREWRQGSARSDRLAPGGKLPND